MVPNNGHIYAYERHMTWSGNIKKEKKERKKEAGKNRMKIEWEISVNGITIGKIFLNL